MVFTPRYRPDGSLVRVKPGPPGSSKRKRGKQAPEKDDLFSLPKEKAVHLDLSADLADRIRNLLKIDGDAGRALLLTATAKQFLLGTPADRLASLLGVSVRHAYRLRQEVRAALARAVSNIDPKSAVGENLYALTEAARTVSHTMLSSASPSERLKAAIALAKITSARHQVLMDLGIVERAGADLRLACSGEKGDDDIKTLFSMLEEFMKGGPPPDGFLDEKPEPAGKLPDLL